MTALVGRTPRLTPRPPPAPWSGSCGRALAEADPAECWALSIPINGFGHMDWSIPFNWQSNAALAPLAVSVRTVLCAKLHTLSLTSDAVPPPQLQPAQDNSAYPLKTM